MCYFVAMRVHITLADDIVRSLDRRVGSRRRSSFIADAVRRALDDERRWELIESSFGTIADEGHDWDDDAAAWVREQRQLDERRVG
jgi:Arc/MetJ-type ribon-helix-helix transcriptional regulator